MTKKELKNIAASVRQRLLNKSRTEIPEEIVAFSREFIKAKQIQWNAFRKKLEQHQVPAEFQDIVSKLEEFIGPIVSALISKEPPPETWSAHGPWV